MGCICLLTLNIETSASQTATDAEAQRETWSMMVAVGVKGSFQTVPGGSTTSLFVSVVPNY